MHRICLVLGLLIGLGGLVPLGAEEDASPPEGFSVTLTEAGAGDPPARGDRVRIHYAGFLADGTPLGSSQRASTEDASRKDKPLTVTLSSTGTIRGVLEACLQMPVGAKATVQIPAAWAYGAQGAPARRDGKGAIPPDADLRYELEMVGIDRQPTFPDPDALTWTDIGPGVRMAVLEEGEGAPPNLSMRVKLRYALWNHEQALVQSTFHQRKHIDGRGDALRLADKGRGEAFLKEAVKLLKKGGRYFFQVEPTQAYGKEHGHKQIPPNTRTYWELSFVEQLALPTFAWPTGDDVTTLPSGLSYQVLRPGKGRKARKGRSCEIHYFGWMRNGVSFDNSYERGVPYRTNLTQVIRGWMEGVPLMREGAIYRLMIPAELAYGRQRKQNIPPNSDLTFHVELMKVW